jgi:hypothetical protein
MVRHRADQVVEPKLQAGKVLLPAWQDAGGDQGVAEVAGGLVLRQLVHQRVADLGAVGGELGQQRRRRARDEPVQH